MFKNKCNEFQEIEKFKSIFFAKGYVKHHEIDYSEIFALVAKLDTIRVTLSMAAQFSWQFFQLDVNNVFLHGELKREVFVQ